MSAHDHAEIDRHVKAAIYVFAALLVLTGFTVGAYYIELPTPAAIGLALIIASAKGFLVTAWFMHLLSEKKLIYWTLILTAVLFIPLLLFPTFTAMDGIGLD